MFTRILGDIIDIVYPRVCLNCGNTLKRRTPAVDNIICADCWTQISKNTPPFCPRCGRHTNSPTCTHCAGSTFYFDAMFSPCVYEGVIATLLKLFKYRGRNYLGSTLGRLMISFIREYKLDMDSIDMVIPIPLHSSRLREREFNQARILAECVAGAFFKPLAADILRRHRPTKTQAELEGPLRLQNVKASFSIARHKPPLKDITVLLVDDVLTTGATLSEAAWALKQYGAKKVIGMTLAN